MNLQEDEIDERAEKYAHGLEDAGLPFHEREYLFAMRANAYEAGARAERQGAQALADEKCRWFLERAEKAEQENARLRAALEFYADRNNYCYDRENQAVVFETAKPVSVVQGDWGQVATKALGK